MLKLTAFVSYVFILNTFTRKQLCIKDEEKDDLVQKADQHKGDEEWEPAEEVKK